MGTTGNSAEKQAQELYRERRKAIFEVYGRSMFWPLDVAEKVRIFAGDTKQVGAWISKAISLGEIELKNPTSRQYVFHSHIIKMLGYDIPIDGILGDSRFSELPEPSEVQPSIKSPATANIHQLAVFDDVHAFVVTVIVAIGGVAGLTIERITQKMKEYKGWDTGRDFSLSVIIKRMLEDGLLHQVGSLKHTAYQITGQSAIRFLNWTDADVLRLGLEPWVRETKTKESSIEPMMEAQDGDHDGFDDPFGSSTNSPSLTAAPALALVREPVTVGVYKPNVSAEDAKREMFKTDKNMQRWIVSLIYHEGGIDFVRARRILALVNEVLGWHDKPFKGLSRDLSFIENETGYLECKGGSGKREFRVTEKALAELFGVVKEVSQAADSPEVPASAPPPPPPPPPELVKPIEEQPAEVSVPKTEVPSVVAPPPAPSPAEPSQPTVIEKLQLEVKRLGGAVQGNSQELANLHSRVSELEEVEEAVVERAVQETLAAMRLLPRHLVPIVLELVATRRREEKRKK